MNEDGGTRNLLCDEFALFDSSGNGKSVLDSFTAYAMYDMMLSSLRYYLYYYL